MGGDLIDRYGAAFARLAKTREFLAAVKESMFG